MGRAKVGKGPEEKEFQAEMASSTNAGRRSTQHVQESGSSHYVKCKAGRVGATEERSSRSGPHMPG